MIRKRAGFSLVEVLVSAAILAIVIIAIVGIVRKARDLQVSDSHRRAARAVLDAQIESVYNYQNFAALTAGTNSRSDTLDPRAGVALIGQSAYTLVPDSQTVNGSKLPVMVLTAKCVWQEPDGSKDSIVLNKILAR